MQTRERLCFLAKDWGYIMTAGSIQFVIGIFALCSPKAASEVLLVLLSAGLLVVGLINLLAMFFVEQSYRCASFISGAVQLTLGILMITPQAWSFCPVSSLPCSWWKESFALSWLSRIVTCRDGACTWPPVSVQP